MLWISHRGFTKKYAENSKEAFSEAESVGFSAIETDLRITKDSQIVLSHDENFSRVFQCPLTTNQSTSSELCQLRAPGGEALYFFHELLQDFEQISWTFDIKEPFGHQCVKQIYEQAKAFKKLEWLRRSCRFLFWSRQTEQYFNELMPGCRLYARYSESQVYCGLRRLGLQALYPLQAERIYGLPSQALGIDFFRESELARIKAKGAESIAFLPATATEAEKAIDAGFEQILSDDRPLN